MFLWQNRLEALFSTVLCHSYLLVHCDVPQSHKEDGENHGLWVSNQRMAFKKGKLDPKRAQRLEGLGMKWRIK